MNTDARLPPLLIIAIDLERINLFQILQLMYPKMVNITNERIYKARNLQEMECDKISLKFYTPAEIRIQSMS